jgi:sugar lactone lactonase YvrE
MSSRVTAIHPSCAIEGGRITIEGAFPAGGPPPDVRIGSVRARVVRASSSSIAVLVPPRLAESRQTELRIEGVAGETIFVEIAASLATGLHQVDNPAFDRAGNLLVTYSGTRGQQVPVSIFRVRPDGTRETFSTGIVNPTSLAFGPDDALYVSSRFEGTVYRVAADGAAEPFGTNLGVACGLTFSSDGMLFVGDRSGTIFRLDPSGKADTFASLPSSVAAFHLACGPDDALYVSAPTLGSYDSIYRIDPSGTITALYSGFGRPQGLAFDAGGTLFAVEALAGASGLYRLPAGGPPELVVAAPGLVGVAFDGRGGAVVCSNDTAYRVAKVRW